ncbi:MAG: glucose-6-phosphate isomerase [Lentisphaerae bacterium]|nr:glucose-6-phosphate isomerase [Lentisphaerota bacterium]
MDWVKRNCEYTLTDGKSGFAISFAGMKFDENDLAKLDKAFAKASAGIADIEAGAIKNPDEQRKVTHFTDRIAYPESAAFAAVETFAAKVIAEGKFDAVVVNGIGGSALGPQLMQFAINGPYWNELPRSKRNGLKIYFLDNTDSSGFADLLKVMEPEKTIHLVISKSGGTQETKNNMIAMEKFYASCNLDFAKYAVAVTMLNSSLYKHAKENNWLEIFEMAESIGGRTSETAIVGHLPAALTGIDFGKFLAGACDMDAWTRNADFRSNPALFLAAIWYLAGNGKGDRNMVIVPYSDRLVLLSRYLQQLVMESLGKELDLDGNVVHQGLNVFGNKGGTDAHAFIQQLNDGRDDFFATFIEVLQDAANLEINDGISMGDYLHGFFEGLSAALRSKGRQTITIRIPQLTVYELGQIIALYERAVAMYAEFININAFHQPGVQAYKLAAKDVLALRGKVLAALQGKSGFSGSGKEFAELAGTPDKAVEVASILDKAALNNGAVSREFNGKNWVYTVK